MNNIPEEYLDSSWDFGFTAIEQPEDIPQPEPVQAVNSEEISGPIVERIAGLESDVSEILSILEHIRDMSVTDDYRSLLEETTTSKLEQVEKLIIPLLVNLMKNPDKSYIHWPNREPLIKSQMDKILAITRS